MTISPQAIEANYFTKLFDATIPTLHTAIDAVAKELAAMDHGKVCCDEFATMPRQNLVASIGATYLEMAPGHDSAGGPLLLDIPGVDYGPDCLIRWKLQPPKDHEGQWKARIVMRDALRRSESDSGAFSALPTSQDGPNAAESATEAA